MIFELTGEEFNKCVEKALSSLSKDLILKGFRPGNVPKEIAEQALGEAKILEEAANIAIRENYIKTLGENKIEAIGQPEIEILKIARNNPLEFKVKVSVMPELKLPDYKTIASKVKIKENIKTDEKEIESAILWLQKSRAKFTIKNQPALKKDFVEISYSSPQIEAGKEFKDKFILGDGHFVPGFEERLEGMKDGEKKEFSINLPKDNKKSGQEGAADKKMDFKVAVISVQKMELPEINDEFAKNIGGFRDLSHLKENIKEGLKTEKTEEARKKNRAEMIKNIAEKTEVEIPEILIESEQSQMLAQLKENVKNQFNISFEDYLSQTAVGGKIKTEAEMKESFKNQAVERVKGFLILREIAKAEKVNVSEKEIEGSVNEFLKRYAGVEEAKKNIDLEKVKEYYEDIIKNEKVFQLLENLGSK